ncbi:phage/plasmid primase, P4 family [Frisingicoccus sp.]|uniref:DNA primase family protein n=1 Tax=Frisingicoccus sp. TaxID=1918627 RepID=UPI00399A2FF0
MNQSQIYQNVTQSYIDTHTPLPDEKTCAEEIVEEISTRIQMENSIRPKGYKIPAVFDIPNISVSMLIAGRTDVALIFAGDKSLTNREMALTPEQILELPIGFYQSDGSNKGLWLLTNSYRGLFGTTVELYKPGATLKEKKEIFALVKSKLRIIRQCAIPYYAPVNNGIVDVLNKKLIPFSPDIVFTSKIHTNLNMQATNPFIPVPEDNSVWNVDDWFNSLGTPTFVQSIKEVIQAACLPLAPREKMCLFYSKLGNNGKGTICQLIRNLLGQEVTVSIPLKEFSARFGLAKLPGAVAVVTDENDVSSFNKGLSTIKAAITGDSINIERKYQDSYDFHFYGLILQCVNDYPNGDDKTGSFKRRLHIIPFEQCFTGAEKKYIKQRLIYREDVLEYILKTVLIDMDYRESFTETPETEQALKTYVSVTNSVASFLEEILPRCKWDLLPGTDFLYEAYKVWYKKISPSGKVVGRNEFLDSVKGFVATDKKIKAEWEWTDSTRSKGYIDLLEPEPLLTEYEVIDMLNMNYSPYSNNRNCPKNVKEKYSGLKRRSATVQATDDEEE